MPFDRPVRLGKIIRRRNKADNRNEFTDSGHRLVVSKSCFCFQGSNVLLKFREIKYGQTISSNIARSVIALKLTDRLSDSDRCSFVVYHTALLVAAVALPLLVTVLSSRELN